jgi:hypothetical protein
MRALFVTSDFWQKPAMGGTHYTNAVLSALRDVAQIREVDVFVAKWPQVSVVRRAVGLLKSILLGGSTFRRVCTSDDLTKLSPQTLSGYDVVVLNGSDQIDLARRIPKTVRVVYVMHNLEADYARTSIAALPAWQQIVLSLTGEVARCSREEEALLRRACAVIGISLDELDAVGSRNPSLVTVWTPPTFEPSAVRRAPRDDRLVVGMLGALDHHPNREALEFFLREAWPHADPRVQLVLAGRGTQAFTDPARRIQGLGLVPRLDDFWQEIDLLAVPILDGAGANVKVCEALANRTPLLATPFALQGLPPIDDPAVCVLDAPEAWRAALRWDRLAAIARARPSDALAELFDRSAVVRRLNDAVQRISV